MQELTDALVARLGIEPEQASGGAAILFRAARTKLGAPEFARLLGGVDGVEALVATAPPPGAASRLFGGLASALAGANGALVADIVGGFGRLGLTTQHARSFVPVITEYLRTRVGPDAVDKLERTLRA